MPFVNLMMVKFNAPILKFSKKGEKTGWSYIEIPQKLAQKLKPDCKVSFRIKGTLDHFPIKQVSVLPMGEGNFILPFNNSFRKGTGKKNGDLITLTLECDEQEYILSPDLMKCLKAEPPLMKFFKSLTGSHQRYFSKWVESAKTKDTKAKRIGMALIAFSKNQGYQEMMRENRAKKF